MIEYKDILANNPSGVPAAQNGDKLDTRVVHALFIDDSKVFFRPTKKRRCMLNLPPTPTRRSARIHKTMHPW